MPRKPKTTATSDEGGFLNYRLSDEEREECRRYCPDAASLWEQVAQLLDSAYVFKLSYDKSNECYACYVSGHWSLNVPDRRWTLTGRGSTWEKALRQALFIHFEVYVGDWSDAKKATPRERSWD